MTIDDISSVYVGGLPYDTTEDSLRDAFFCFGGIVAVKIINDRGIGGKCYGFVTFRNPRSATDAIKEMDGADIGGRIVKVNGVRTKPTRPGFGRESFRRNHERGMDWDRGRVRERRIDDERFHNRNRDRSRDHDFDRGRPYDTRDHDQSRDQYRDRDHDDDRNLEEFELEHGLNHEHGYDRDRDLDWDTDRDIDRARDVDRSSERDRDGARHSNQHAKKQSGSHLSDHRSTDLSSESSGDYLDQVKEQLDMSIQRLEDLRKEIPKMENILEEKRHHVLDLQNKSQKLEDALTSAKKVSSNRRMQLGKLHKYSMQVADYTERLKNSERELQSMVETAMIEVDVGEDGGF